MKGLGDYLDATANSDIYPTTSYDNVQLFGKLLTTEIL